MDLESLTKKKQQLDAYRPLPLEIVRNLDQWFRVELTYTSNAIEGNTLTRQETALVVEKGITIGGKSLTEHLEATNHARVLDWIYKQIDKKPDVFTEKDILFIHELILKSIDEQYAGRYRSVPVRISGSSVILPNPMKVPSLMNELIQWFQSYSSLHPVEFAARAHYTLVSIHPFVDGNGRTARLLMNVFLLMQGYPPAVIEKRDRIRYLNSLEKAQLGGSIDPYTKLIFQSVNRSLDIYIKAITNQEYEPERKENEYLKLGQLQRK